MTEFSRLNFKIEFRDSCKKQKISSVARNSNCSLNKWKNYFVKLNKINFKQKNKFLQKSYKLLQVLIIAAILMQ